MPITQNIQLELYNTSKNLFNKDTATDGYYLDNANNITKLTGFGYSDYIQVNPSTLYTGWSNTRSNPIRFSTFYDNQKNLITGGSNTNSSSFTTSATTFYIRFTYEITSTYNKNTFMLFKGSSFTQYEPFIYGLNPKYKILPDNASKFVSKSVNLFNKDEAFDGVYLSNTNTITTNSAFGYSGYIAVTPGKKYYANDAIGTTICGVSSSGTMRFTTYFDSNKNYVAGGSSTSINNFICPAGVYFIRFTYNIATVNGSTCGKNTIQFEENTAITNYQPFNYQFTTNNTFNELRSQQVIWGSEKLRRFQSWKRLQDYAYNVVMIGDSYTDGNYFCQKIRDILLGKGLPDGGPGWVSFFNAGGSLASGSIKNSELTCTATVGDWTDNYGFSSNTYSISGSDAISTGANKTITITAGRSFNTIRVVYNKTTGGAGFTWKIGSGSETTVSTSGSVASYVDIDTSSSGSSFTITLKSLGAGVSLSGAKGIVNGNNLVINKCGLTGSHAGFFGLNSTSFPTSVTAMNPSCLIIMFGTNDIALNTVPSIFKANIQRVVNYFRLNNPTCDLIFMCPCYSRNGSESGYIYDYTTDDYANAFYQLAQENDGVFIDFTKVFGKWGQYLIDANFMSSDRIHPSTNGNELFSQTISKVMLNGTL